MTGERHVGEVVRRLRRALDLIQRDLAQRAYCATGTVRRIESGDLRPSRELAAQLAAALGVPDADREAFLALARRRPGDPAPPTAGDGGGPGAADGVLPVPLGALVGRDHAVATALEVLGEVRLVTLTGPPGVGKTTLALAVARAAASGHPDGVLWVPLADVPTEELAPAAVARAAGLQLPPDAGNGTGRLVTALHAQRRLLVLDNVEHLPRLATMVSALLAGCPGLTVLATGRTALRAEAEQEFPVHPLAEAPAVELFLARARAAVPGLVLDGADLDAVAAICRRLDGLPLALELAARRLRLLAPRDLLAALDAGVAAFGAGRRDGPARQATMHDAVAWSYRLLTPVAARVLDRLSVFAGGAAPAAVAVVCDDRDLAGTAELAEHNLVLADGGRVRLLEVVRSYAAARLRERGDERAARDRHLEHAVELARAGRRGLAGPDQPAWLLALDADVPNLAAACSWACATGRAERAAEVAGDLWWFWWASGRWLEARSVLDGVRAHRPALGGRSRARVDFAEAHLAFLTGDLPRCRRISASLAHATASAPVEAAYAACFAVALDGGPLRSIEEQLHAVRRAAPGGAEQHLGTLLSGCALVAVARGALAPAQGWVDEATLLYAELGQPYGRGVTENLSGDLARLRGDLGAAEDHYASAVTALRAALVRPDLPAALANLADVRLALGAVDEARDLLTEALGLQWRLGNRLGQARCLGGLAAAEARDGDPAEAAALLAASAASSDGCHPMSTPTTVDVPALTEDVRGRLDPQTWAAAWQQGAADPDACVRRMLAR